MKQSSEQVKRLILADLVYALREISELNGYLGESVDLELTVESLSSAIRLIAEREIK